MVRGWTIAQADPSAVCLYRTENSRHIRNPSNSRCDHISSQLIPTHPVRAEIMSSWALMPSGDEEGKTVPRAVGSLSSGVDEINESCVFIIIAIQS